MKTMRSTCTLAPKLHATTVDDSVARKPLTVEASNSSWARPREKRAAQASPIKFGFGFTDDSVVKVVPRDSMAFFISTSVFSERTKRAIQSLRPCKTPPYNMCRELRVDGYFEECTSRYIEVLNQHTHSADTSACEGTDELDDLLELLSHNRDDVERDIIMAWHSNDAQDVLVDEIQTELTELLDDLDSLRESSDCVAPPDSDQSTSELRRWYARVNLIVFEAGAHE